ncbi:hypothetical protein KAU33_01310 [Candidatus Dependentiae bacterium]|nr:hypothetical protein [Candidatus Dependentiae bacterium]
MIPINRSRYLSFKKDGIKYKITTSGYQIKINEDFCIDFAGGHSDYYTVNDKYIVGIYYDPSEKELDKYKVCIYDKINQKYNYIIEYSSLECTLMRSRLKEDYLILEFVDYSNRKRYYNIFNLKYIMNKSDHVKIKIHSIFNYFIFNNELRVLDSNKIIMYKGDKIEKINLVDKHIEKKDYVIFFNDDSTILYNKQTILLFKNNKVKKITNVGDIIIEKIVYHYNNKLVVIDENNEVLLFDISTKKIKKIFKYFRHFYYLNKLFILSENNHLYKFENNKFNKVYGFKDNYKYIKIYNYESYIFLLGSDTGNGIIIYKNIISNFCIHRYYLPFEKRI